SVTNSGSSVKFDAITYSGTGEYVYSITETAVVNGNPEYSVNSTPVYAKVSVSLSGNAYVASVKYYSDEPCTTEVTSPTITNTYTRETGNLEITKKTTGATTPESTEFTISGPADFTTVTYTYKDFTEGVLTLTDIPTGDYTIVENVNGAKVDDYTLSVTGDGTVATTVVTGETAKVTIENTYTRETGSLEITKKTTGATTPESTEFTISGPADFTTVTYTYKDFTEGVLTLTDIPTGDYTIVESVDGAKVDGYTLSVTGEGTVTTTVVAGETAKATIENTYTRETGNLTVTKTVAGSVVDTTKEFSFTVTLSDTTLNGTFGEMTFKDGVATFTLKHGESKTATGIPAGTTYTVTEESYTADGYVTTSTGTSGTIVKDETQTAAVTNTITSVKISKVDVTTEEELPGATIQIIDKDGTVVDEWVSTDQPHETTGLVPGETYTLRETVAPEGYDITTDTTFTLKEDGTIDTSKTTTTISEEGVLLVEDSMTKSETAEISVTKSLQLSNGDGLVAADETFYVGLYADEACTKLYASKAIEFKNAAASTVTFTDLEIGRTYYIAECDSTGTALASGIGALAGGTIYQAIFDEGATVTKVTVADGTLTTVSFANEFYTVPDGFYKKGTLTITKKLLGADGAALTSDAVFYAGIFTDASYTTLATNVDQSIVTLDLAGGSEASVDVVVSISTGSSVTLYVTETDADGNPVADAEGFAYTVSQNTTEVTLDETNNTATVTITNQEIVEVEEEESEEVESETESEAVQTGDETPLALYFSLMLMAVAVMLAGETRRRRRYEDED
ncbi:MAG: DUF5979 domain-containing protein, partial [Clostridiales bacterium]|nr:DUF5979 domain-containing protein [Clostridiales bacterium]